jgi:glycosyltransferase involved in cell wall biosynthesis
MHCFPSGRRFGIVALMLKRPVKPVIALNRGGAAETVIHGQTGILYPDASPDMIIEAINQAKNCRWSVAQIKAQADRYDEAVFRAKFSQVVEAYVRT